MKAFLFPSNGFPLHCTFNPFTCIGPRNPDCKVSWPSRLSFWVMSASLYRPCKSFSPTVFHIASMLTCNRVSKTRLQAYSYRPWVIILHTCNQVLETQLQAYIYLTTCLLAIGSPRPDCKLINTIHLLSHSLVIESSRPDCKLFPNMQDLYTCNRVFKTRLEVQVSRFFPYICIGHFHLFELTPIHLQSMPWDPKFHPCHYQSLVHSASFKLFHFSSFSPH